MPYHSAKLTTESYEDILRSLRRGESKASIATRLNLSVATVRNVGKGYRPKLLTWRPPKYPGDREP